MGRAVIEGVASDLVFVHQAQVREDDDRLLVEFLFERFLVGAEVGELLGVGFLVELILDVAQLFADGVGLLVDGDWVVVAIDDGLCELGGGGRA